MTSVFDVASYILQIQGRMTTMKLHKLIYFCQAWSLAWGEGPLFSEPIEAWQEGPVAREVWETHRGKKWISSLENGDPDALFVGQKDTILTVLGFYRQKEAEELSAITHGDTPWIEAYHWDGIIRPKSMAHFYRDLDVGALGAEGKFLLKGLLAKVGPDNKHAEVDWGHPVGREVW